MSDLTFSPEFENQIRAAMAVPDPTPAFLNDLRQQLIAQSEKTQSTPLSIFQRPTLRWGVAILVVLVFALLVIGPQRVASAFQRLLGYIPGFGLVDQNVPLRVLEEPVTQRRGGATVTVDQVFLDTTQTVLHYRFDGVSMVSRSETDIHCTENPSLRLPDGQVLEPDTGWGTGWDTGFEFRFEYPPVPADINEAIFFVPCLDGGTSDNALENWEIPLRFIPAPPELTVYPIIELPTPTASQVPSVTPDAPPEPRNPAQATTPMPQNTFIYLTLDRVAQLEDGYIFYATLYWDSDTYTHIYTSFASLLDANGQEIPLEDIDPTYIEGPNPHEYPLAFKAIGPFIPGPLTLRIENVEAQLPVDASFTFDVGPNPQPGDVWELNQEIDVAGYGLTVLSVRVVSHGDNLGYEFAMETSGALESALLVDQEHAPIGGGGQPQNLQTTQIFYQGDLPSGQVTISIPSILIKLPGPWQTDWTPSEDLQITATPQKQGASLTLDRVVQLDDGYIFYATFYWHNDAYTSALPGWYTLLDANGREIPHEDLSDEKGDSSVPYHHPIALKAQAPLPPGPVTISVDNVDVSLPVEAGFSFDAGPNPEIGQEWMLNQNIEVAGYALTIQSVRAVMERGNPSYEFEILADDEVTFVWLKDQENPTAGGSGAGGGGGPLYTRISYPHQLPIGSVTISITELALFFLGPWQATWNPSEDLQLTVAPPPEQAACLTHEIWQQAQMQVSIIPSDLSGKILRFGPVGDNQEDWGLSTSRLDGSELQVIDVSYHSALSPDGTQLAYTDDDGLSILDLLTQQTTRLPGTDLAFYQPHWSPDGSRIAFVRLLDDFNLFLTNTDGTGLQQLTQSVASEELVGWLADGEHLLYALNGADGKSLYQMNVESREVEPLFTGHEATQSGFAISPDGRRLAYVEDVFGNQKVLYVSNLDGSDSQAIIDVYPALIADPVWGPEPEWLLIQVFDPEVNILLSTPMLVNVETCQVVVLSNLPGEITSWGP